MVIRPLGRLAVTVCACLLLTQLSSKPSHATDYGAEIPVPRKALVISVGDYEFLAPIPTASTDLEKMKLILDEVGFQTTSVLNPTKDELWDAIDKFQDSVQAGDLVVVYYSGHGFQWKGESFFVGKDVKKEIKEDNITRDVVGLQGLISRITNKKSAYALFILDACRENNVNIAEGTITKALGADGLADISLAQFPTQVVVAYATAPGKLAATVNDPAQNSLYTRHLIDQLPKPGKTVLDILYATTNDVYREDRRERPEAPQHQRPEYRVLAPMGGVYPRSDEAAQKTLDATWQEVLQSKDPAQMRDFIDMWPVSNHTAMARQWLADNESNFSTSAPRNFGSGEIVAVSGSEVAKTKPDFESGNRWDQPARKKMASEKYKEVEYYESPSKNSRALGTIRAGDAFIINKDLPPAVDRKHDGTAKQKHDASGKQWSQVVVPGSAPGAAPVVGYIESDVRTAKVPATLEWSIAGPSETDLVNRTLIEEVRNRIQKDPSKDALFVVKMPNLVPWAKSEDAAGQAVFLMGLQIKSGLVGAGIPNENIIVQSPLEITCKVCSNKSSIPSRSSETKVMVVAGQQQ